MPKFSREVEVVQIIRVTVDESKFTPEFMQEFRDGFFPFETIGEHLDHLGQLYARGVIDGSPDEFIEGYGPASEMGISFERTTMTVDTITAE